MWRGSLCTLLVLLSKFALALDVWIPESRVAPLIFEDQRRVLESTFSSTLRLPIRSLTYNPDDIARFEFRRGYVFVDSWRYREFLDLGWRPVARGARQDRLAVYQLEELDHSPTKVGLVQAPRIEFFLAPAFVSDSVDVQLYDRPESCLRSLYLDVEGCLVRQSEAVEYEGRFGVALKTLDFRPVVMPGSILMSKNVAADDPDLTGARLMGETWVLWHDFDARFYAGLLNSTDRAMRKTNRRSFVQN